MFASLPLQNESSPALRSVSFGPSKIRSVQNELPYRYESGSLNHPLSFISRDRKQAWNTNVCSIKHLVSNIKGRAAERAINHSFKHLIIKTHNPLRLKLSLYPC